MNRGHRIRRLVVVLLSLSLLAAACGGEKEVGQDITIDPDAQGGEGGIRDTSTTTAAPTSTTQAQTQNTQASTTTAAPTTTTTQAAVVNVIKVQDDTQGLAFDPQVLQVPQGQIVRWTNVGTRPYQIKFSDNSVLSPELAPGDSFDWVADRTGTFDYTDAKRPYAQARVQVF